MNTAHKKESQVQGVNSPDETVRLAREGLLFTLLSIFGKLFGFLREWMIAFFFGAGIISDAYRVAVDFTRSITLLLSGNTNQVALVPLLTKWRIRNYLKSRALLFRVIAWGSLIISFVLMIALVFGSDLIARLQAPDYSAEELKIISMMLRWIAPTIPIFVAESMITILLMSVMRYRLLGYTTLVMNATQMAAIILVSIGKLPLQLLPISYWISSIFVSMLLLIDARHWWIREKARIAFRRSWIVARRFLVMLLPLMIVGLANQLSLFMDRRFVSELTVGAIAALYFARFIAEAPSWTLGRTINSMILPYFSELVERGDNSKLRHQFLILLDFSLWLLVPIIVLFTCTAHEIITLVYGYGSFDQQAIELSTAALIGASPGIWTNVMHPILNRVTLAQERANILLPFGILRAALNIGLAWYLVKEFGIFGVAISIGIAQFLVIVSMFPFLRIGVTSAAIARISLWIVWATALILLFTYIFQFDSDILRILSVASVILPAWLIASFVFPHGKENMQRLYRLARRMR